MWINIYRKKNTHNTYSSHAYIERKNAIDGKMSKKYLKEIDMIYLDTIKIKWSK